MMLLVTGKSRKLKCPSLQPHPVVLLGALQDFPRRVGYVVSPESCASVLWSSQPLPEVETGCNMMQIFIFYYLHRFGSWSAFAELTRNANVSVIFFNVLSLFIFSCHCVFPSANSFFPVILHVILKLHSGHTL